MSSIIALVVGLLAVLFGISTFVVNPFLGAGAVVLGVAIGSAGLSS